MKAFFKKIVIFHTIAILLLLLLVYIPILLIKNNSTFKINRNKSIVVMGHSHPQCAFNDSIISNVRNLANSGESYFYTFQKLKKVIPDNPQFKTVFIEFSNNQIDKNMDEWIWGYEKMSHFLPRYSSFINREDFNLLLKNNFKDLSTCVSIFSKKNLYRVINSDYNFKDEIGGYQWLDKNDLKKSNIDIDYSSTSEVNLVYLRKIIDYCKANNINIYLIRSPQNKALEFLQNESLFQEIRTNNFSDLEFFDFNNFPILDEDFADLDHLNYKGARKFSIMITKLLENNFLESKNKEEIINELMKSYPDH